MANLQRKADQAEKMFTKLVALMQNELSIKHIDEYTKETEVPSWV